MSNGGLIKSLEKCGVSVEISDVGDKNVCDLMSSSGAVLGGERSGHIILSKYETTGDGLLTAVMIMEAVIESKRTLTELLKEYKALPQITLSIPVADKKAVSAAVADMAEKIQRSMGVRLVVRCSGTEEVIRIMAEGESYETCVAACGRISEIIKEV